MSKCEMPRPAYGRFHSVLSVSRSGPFLRVLPPLWVGGLRSLPCTKRHGPHCHPPSTRPPHEGGVCCKCQQEATTTYQCREKRKYVVCLKCYERGWHCHSPDWAKKEVVVVVDTTAYLNGNGRSLLPGPLGRTSDDRGGRGALLRLWPACSVTPWGCPPGAHGWVALVHFDPNRDRVLFLRRAQSWWPGSGDDW